MQKMTKVSYFLVDELPPVVDLVIGGIYFLNDGRQFIVKSDKSVLEIGKIEEDEIKYDQSVRIDTLPNSFTSEKTIATFSRASGGATGFLKHLEDNYRLNNLEYSSTAIVTVETERLNRSGNEESITQTITLKNYSSLGDPWGEDVLQSICKLVRVKVPGANRFRDMGLFPVNLYLKDMPASGLNGAYYGIGGATIYIASTDTKYVCVSELQSGFSSLWKKMVNPTVLNVTDAPTPPSGEDFVYDAESVKEMVDGHASVIASETRLGHVKIDGETITIDGNGKISAVSNHPNGEYVVDNTKTLTSALSTFINGKTVTYLPKSVANVTFNNELKWTLANNSTHFDYVLETEKSGDIGYQTLSAYYKTTNLFQLMGKIRRTTSTSTSWGTKWNSDVVFLNYDTNSTIDPHGMYGMIRYVASTGKMYGNTNKTAPNQYGWVEMVNKASTSSLGSVKIDGTTITIDNDGVISAVGNNSNEVLLDYDLGDDIPVGSLPLGHTVSYFSEANVSEEKDGWVNLIGEHTYWAYPMENYVLTVFTTNDGTNFSQKVDIGMHYIDENDVVHTGLMGSLYRIGNIDDGYMTPTISINSIVGTEPSPENAVYAFKGVIYNSTGEGARFYKHDEYSDIISNTEWEEIEVSGNSTSFKFKSFDSVGLEVGDLHEYTITPDITLIITRTIRNGHVSASLKSTNGVELTGLDVQWRANTAYNLDDGVLGAEEVKVIDTGVYVNNTEYPSFMIRYNNRVFRGEVMISGYLTTNKFFVFSEEL